MMGEKRIKYIFISISTVLLGFMLLMSRDAGVTCDEVLHYQQSVSVYNYFASHGKDQTALNTPVTNLKYYGQSYDNLTTILIRWLNIRDIYGFRHIMSAVAGWLTILITALFAAWITGYRTGIIVLLLFAVSPTFLGHAQNNLKDIPFALGYISGIFFTLKFLKSGKWSTKKDALLLTLSIAFCISIRAGGILLICYLFLFFFLYFLSKYLQERKADIQEIWRKLIWTCGISLAGYFLSIILWPFAIQNPLLNPLRSLNTMVRFPSTFRQIFEGKFDWSDFMPWNYLSEYMAVTIPIVVLVGLAIFILLARKIFSRGKAFIYWILVFSIVFPILFVIFEKSNLYSGWRHFLFLYPAIIILASAGFDQLLQLVKSRYVLWSSVIILALLSIHPVKFMALNHRYSYLYYNQLVGGLKAAFGNYETDYYFVSLKEGSEWLVNYLEERKNSKPVKVGSNFSVEWFFRNHPEVKNGFFRYEERSCFDWDYAIVTDRYIPPLQLKKMAWPPGNAIKVIYADEVPICAVLERKTKDDFLGYEALQSGQAKAAIKFFEQALKINDEDEMIYYNFAVALNREGQSERSDSLLNICLEINPDFEPAIMYLGNIAAAQGKRIVAQQYYESLITKNRKYFEAYVELSKLLTGRDNLKARELLRTCIKMSPGYIPAIKALADTYRKTDPGIAEKYDDMANIIEQNK